MKTKFILHGGNTSEKNELNESYFAEMVNDVPEGGTMLNVYFASKDDDVERKFAKDKERMLGFSGEKSIEVVCATREDFMKQLQTADVVYIRGGDPVRLQNTLSEFSELKSALSGKTISGSSAGAYVVSRYYFSNSRNGVFEGLGFVPARLVGHFESQTHHDASAVDPLGAMESYDNNLELIVLKDHEWVVREVDL